MAKIVTMGEIMLRLSTPGFSRFVQTDRFDAVYGGGEANVAVSLARFGHAASFVTKLPLHEIGQSAVDFLRKNGVDTRFIARGGDRVGIYYLESGASMRPSKVIYDRADSAFARAEVSDFNFDEIFKDADWFHWSGITPALGPKARAILLEALKAAKRHQVTVSVDLNYRKKLWTLQEARETLTQFLQYCDVCVDVCLGVPEDEENCLGIKKGTTGNEFGVFEDMFMKMKEQYGLQYIATTLRENHSASENGLSALIYDGNELYHSRHYDIRIVDRIGGGDAFTAGLIHGLVTQMNMKEALEFAVAAGALKHTIPGDFNLVSVDEVQTLASGDASGRVDR